MLSDICPSEQLILGFSLGLPGFPGGFQAPPTNAGDVGLISGLGRCPGEGNGNPLQYSCLKNTMDRRAWWATVPGVANALVRVCVQAHTHTGVYQADYLTSTIR